jgi:hypothetical protein
MGKSSGKKRAWGDERKIVFSGYHVKIQPEVLTLFPQFEKIGFTKKTRSVNSMANLKLKRANNVVSEKSRKRMKAGMAWLRRAARWKTVQDLYGGKQWYFKMTFFTLTISAENPDKSTTEIKADLLEPFLAYARAHLGLGSYIWKAERTEAGTLHFHFVCDTFILSYALRKSWNRLQRKKGYLEGFYRRYGHYNAPCENIRAISDQSTIDSEIGKYVAKSDDQGELIEGRLWGCSYNLSEAIDTKEFIENGTPAMEIVNEWSKMMRAHEVQVINKNDGSIFSPCTLFFPEVNDWMKKSLEPIKRLYDLAIISIRNAYIPTQYHGYKISY